MRIQHKNKTIVAIFLFSFIISSFNISAQNVPKELSFVMPELSFPSTNIMGFLKLPYVGFDHDSDIWYHANGQKANYGNVWFHSNGEKANYGDVWFHSNGEKANYGNVC